jgi:hypothetical protein
MRSRIHQRHLRLQHCLDTILEVHEFMGGQMIQRDIIQQLEGLKDLINHFQIEVLTEPDLLRIENSTNTLLEELAKLFRLKNLGPIHSGRPH